MDAGDNILLEVTIPENAVPLSTITVQAPDGRFFEITVPDKMEPGNVISVQIPKQSAQVSSSNSKTTPFDGDEDAPIIIPKNDHLNTTQKAGVVVGAIVAPIVTGIVVVGAVVANSAMKKSAAEEADPTVKPTVLGQIGTKAKNLDEQNHITETVHRVGNTTYNTLNELDRSLGVSATASKVVDRVQEADQQYKISETVVGTVKDFDQKYAISATTVKAVNSATTKAQELDQEYKVTEKVAEVSAQAVQSLNSAFSFGAEKLSSYWNKDKANNQSGGATTPDGKLDQSDIL